MKAELLFHIPGTILGEGPVWDHRTGFFWWVDITRNLLHQFDPKTEKSTQFEVGQMIGAAVPCQSSPDKFVVGLHHGVGYYEPMSGKLEILADPESDLPNHRFNDGKCDPAGRFWTGTMMLEPPRDPVGNLYCFDKEFKTHHKASHVTVSNGLAWTRDAQTMYYVDSPTNQVRAFDFELSTGKISKGRVALQFEGENFPDGMCIDEADNLWIAFWGKAKVCCYDPRSQQQLNQIDIPALRPTSCCFTGPDMDTLFITSARSEGDEHGGAVFMAKPGVKGVGTSFFKD